MLQRFAVSARTVRGLAVTAAVVAATLHAPGAGAVAPGDNGRTVYLKHGDVMVFDGTFNYAVATDHDWQDRVTWCGPEAVVGERAGIGIVKIPVDRHSTSGTPFVIYRDPGNSLRDPACNAAGTRVAAVAGDTIVAIPTDGRSGPNPLAMTQSGKPAHEPAWSSDDRLVAFEDDLTANPNPDNLTTIEIASTSGRFVAGGTPVTPPSAGLRHGPSWWKNKIYYWKQVKAGSTSLGIFSVSERNMNEFGPYGGTAGEACIDPAAFPDGSGFECVGSDTIIKAFPGPRSLNDTDAEKPDVEPVWGHHDHDHDHWVKEHHHDR